MITEQLPTSDLNKIVVEYDQQRQDLLRFARYMTMDDTSESWTYLLGPDVNSQTHPAVTAGIVIEFIDFERSQGTEISLNDEKQLMTAAWIHDWGELTINTSGVGDVSYDQKQQMHEEVEMQIFQKIMDEVAEDDETKVFLTEVFTTIAMNKTTQLGEVFDTIERIGYLRTALRAFVGIDGERILNWNGLVGNVLSNQIQKLLIKANDNPFVENELSKNADIVSSAFASVNEAGTILDADGNLPYDQEKLNNAHEAWQKSTFV